MFYCVCVFREQRREQKSEKIRKENFLSFSERYHIPLIEKREESRNVRERTAFVRHFAQKKRREERREQRERRRRRERREKREKKREKKKTFCEAFGQEKRTVALLHASE